MYNLNISGSTYSLVWKQKSQIIDWLVKAGDVRRAVLAKYFGVENLPAILSAISSQELILFAV